MSAPFGLPGPGGSLGMCCICGEPFLLEILLGKSIKTLSGEGINNGQELCVHEKCVPKSWPLDLESLPDKSPLKIAYKNGGHATFTV